MHKIPVIIINWNGIEDTKECIKSVLKINYPDFKIYLVDNGSDNDEGEMLKKLYHNNLNIDVIINKGNLGFAKANTVIVESLLDKDVKYVALLNNDTVVDAEWLNQLVACAEEENAQVISSKMIQYYERNKMDNAGHFMLNTGEILPIGHGKQISEYSESFENIGACAGACLYAVEMIRNIGFFDDYFTTGYEDAEFGLRAFLAGYNCVYAPKAIVYHKMGQSIKKVFNEEYSQMIHQSILYSFFKLMPQSIIMLAFPFIILRLIIVILIFTLFMKWKYLKIIIKAWNASITSKRKFIIAQRSTFQNKFNLVNTKKIFSKQHFFLGYDLMRFWNIFILKKEANYDQY